MVILDRAVIELVAPLALVEGLDELVRNSAFPSIFKLFLFPGEFARVDVFLVEFFAFASAGYLIELVSARLLGFQT